MNQQWDRLLESKIVIDFSFQFFAIPLPIIRKQYSVFPPDLYAINKRYSTSNKNK